MKTIILNLIAKIRQRVKLQNQSDEGADVLVVGLITLPLIIGAVGFALDITKNIYLANAYEAMAQQAVNAASNERNVYGNLVSSSGQRFVNEYSIQRGDTLSDSARRGSNSMSTQTRETQAFRSDKCNSATPEDLNADVNISQFPRIELSYHSDRSDSARGLSNQGPFINQGYAWTTPMSGFNPTGNVILEATVYDVSNNFLFAIFGNDCQLYTSNVSSIPVLDDTDYSR